MKSKCYPHYRLSKVTNKSSFTWNGIPNFTFSGTGYCRYISNDKTLDNNRRGKCESCWCLGFLS